MSQVVVRAYAFAATFRLRELIPCFPGAEVELVVDELHVRYPDGTLALVYDFGALVVFGGEGRREEIAQAVGQRDGGASKPFTEDFLVVVDPEAPPGGEVRFDRVVVRELSPGVQVVVALLVAQSAAMDYYGDDVASVLDRTGAITRDLQIHGRFRGRIKEITRFIGTCIQTRNAVIETLALFDKPDITWEVEHLDKLYVRLREVLEIEDRFRNLEYRLRMIQDNLVLLVDLSRQRQTIYLEVVVVLLILFEALIMLWQILRGSGH